MPVEGASTTTNLLVASIPASSDHNQHSSVLQTNKESSEIQPSNYNHNSVDVTYLLIDGKISSISENSVAIHSP